MRQAGMDVERVRSIAAQFEAQSKALDTTCDAIQRIVADAQRSWRGVDAESFNDAWRQHRSNLTAAGAMMANLGTLLLTNAAEQDEASSGHGLGTGTHKFAGTMRGPVNRAGRKNPPPRTVAAYQAICQRKANAASSCATFQVQSHPGAGQVWVNLFIPDAEARVGPMGSKGDNRSFSPTAGPRQSRAAILIDYETGQAIVVISPSHELDGDPHDAFPLNVGSGGFPDGTNALSIRETGDTLTLGIRAENSAPSVGEFGSATRLPPSIGPVDLVPAIDGTLSIEVRPDQTVAIRYAGDDYPALEAYRQPPGGRIITVLRDSPGGGIWELMPIFEGRDVAGHG